MLQAELSLESYKSMIGKVSRNIHTLNNYYCNNIKMVGKFAFMHLKIHVYM